MAIIVPKKLDRARFEEIAEVDSGWRRELSSDGGSKLPGCIINGVKGKIEEHSVLVGQGIIRERFLLIMPDERTSNAKVKD